MTQPQDQVDGKEVLHNVTIGDVTVKARAIDGNQYTVLLVRLQIAQKKADDADAFLAHVRAMADVLGKLVPDDEHQEALLELISTGEVSAEEVIKEICLAGATREERRSAGRASAATRESPGRRHRSGAGRRR